MPWEIDGRKWHTHDRIAHNGKPCRWDGGILADLIDLLEARDEFAPTNWNARGVVEVSATKSKSTNWFLHAMTGDEWALTLRFRVAKNRFDEATLQAELGLKEFDDLDDVAVYGRQSRVRVKKEQPPWQEVSVALLTRDEYESPAFQKLLSQAIESYLETMKPETLNLDDLTPWKKLGRKWHVMRKGFLKGKIVWEAEVVEQVFQLLEEIWPVAKIDWSGKVLVNYRIGSRKFATVTTKRPAGVDLDLHVPAGSVALGRFSHLGTESSLRPGAKGLDVVSLRFTAVDQITNGQLREFINGISPR